MRQKEKQVATLIVKIVFIKKQKNNQQSNMTETLKLFMVKGELYLVSNEKVIIGDKALVTVGDEFPSIVECQNDDQIKLFQESKFSLTRRYKILQKVNDVENDLKKHFKDKDGFILVEIENGKITIKETEE